MTKVSKIAIRIIGISIEWLLVAIILFAFFMVYVALEETTATWLFWKTGGFYIAFGAFMLTEMIILNWYMRKCKK